MQEAEHEVAGLGADVARHADRDLADLLEELLAVLVGGGRDQEEQGKEEGKMVTS